MKCPRCGGLVLRDYDEWTCFSCGPLAPEISDERRAALQYEMTPILADGRVRRSKAAHHIIGGKHI